MPIQLTKCRPLLAFASAALVATSRIADAQTDSAKTALSATVVSVRLHIVHENDTPIVGAEVFVKGNRIERVARSDSSGIARVEGLTRSSPRTARETVAVETPAARATSWMVLAVRPAAVVALRRSSVGRPAGTGQPFSPPASRPRTK